MGQTARSGSSQNLDHQIYCRSYLCETRIQSCVLVFECFHHATFASPHPASPTLMHAHFQTQHHATSKIIFYISHIIRSKGFHFFPLPSFQAIFLSQQVHQNSNMPSYITSITAAQRLDSRGNPTVQVRLTTDKGTPQILSKLIFD